MKRFSLSMMLLGFVAIVIAVASVALPGHSNSVMQRDARTAVSQRDP